MGMVINTNTASLTAQRHLAESSQEMQTSMERLASGKRINSSMDDAAGLAIRDRMTAEINGLNQAVRNGNDGIALLQTMEGAMEEVTGILQRMRQLAVQGANDTLDADDRTNINSELSDLMTELSRIDGYTTFNDSDVFGTSGETVNINVDVDGTVAAAVSISKTDVSKTGLGLSTTSVVVTTITEAAAAIALLDTAITDVADARADYGSKANRLEFTVSNLMNVSEHTSAARSRIEDTDYAQESANLARTQVLQQAGSAMLAQANASTQNVLSLLK